MVWCSFKPSINISHYWTAYTIYHVFDLHKTLSSSHHPNTFIGGVAEADPAPFCPSTLGGLHFPDCLAVGPCDRSLANGIWER